MFLEWIDCVFQTYISACVHAFMILVFMTGWPQLLNVNPQTKRKCNTTLSTPPPILYRHCGKLSALNRWTYNEIWTMTQEKNEPWITSLDCALLKKGNSHSIWCIFWLLMTYGATPMYKHSWRVLNNVFYSSAGYRMPFNQEGMQEGCWMGYLAFDRLSTTDI